MFRGPPRSKATPSTLCQKCLKRDNYECNASAQDRPYKSRPSRTQQLLNPKLKPKLMTDVPNDLLQKKGIADAILAKNEEARGRKHGPDDDDDPSPRKRSRSVSSTSTVSTISTNRSRSLSRSPMSHDGGRDYLMADLPSGKDKRKRNRRSVSSNSYSSDTSHDRNRNTRRRMSSFSPMERGRRRSRLSNSSPMETSNGYHALSNGKRAMSPSLDRIRARSKGRDRRRRSSPRYRSRQRRLSLSRSRSRSPSRGKHGRNSRSRSPLRGGRGRDPYSRRMLSRSRSPYRSADSSHPGNTNGARGDAKPRRSRFDEGQPRSRFDDVQPRAKPLSNGHHAAPPPRKERSLSPYSKRLALTQAMNTGAR